MKSALSILLLNCIFLPAMSEISVPAESEMASQASAPANVRSLAESQHEIVMLLLKKNAYDQALAEANKIFEMKWPEDQEPVLLKEILFISDQFLHENQAPMAISLLENNIKAFKKAPSQAAIWKEKGYLFKRMGQDEKALNCFREAQRMEKPAAK
jgi:tetratricopeptide (TPR) repeat protein